MDARSLRTLAAPDYIPLASEEEASDDDDDSSTPVCAVAISDVDIPGGPTGPAVGLVAYDLSGALLGTHLHPAADVREDPRHDRFVEKRAASDVGDMLCPGIHVFFWSLINPSCTRD